MDKIHLHKQLADEAYKQITAGLDKEQMGNDIEGALDLYRKGVQSMTRALNMSFESEADRTKAQTLNDKMAANLEQIKDRIATILISKSGSKATIQSTSKIANAPSKRLELKGATNHTMSPKNIRSAVMNSRERVRSSSKSSNNSGSSSAIKFGVKSSSNVGNQGDSESDGLKQKILDEVLSVKPNVTWDDVAGLDAAKLALHEIVVLPNLRPELFTGLRTPAKGVLLFGPPGTGKTMLAKAVAHESKATFFSISASSLTSKHFGEGEKLVKALFDVARQNTPSIVFIDEIDSILTQRSESEHEASRRLKTEFLLQFDGVGTSNEDRILILAASNRPQELDEAALRRFVKRVYIPLPEGATRKALLVHLLKEHKHSLSENDIQRLVASTEGYSCSDLTALAREASMGPIRSLGNKLMSTRSEQIRGINLPDFASALKIIRASVSPSSIKDYEEWNKNKGSSGA